VISPTLAHSSRMSSLISRVAAGSSCEEGGLVGGVFRYVWGSCRENYVLNQGSWVKIALRLCLAWLRRNECQGLEGSRMPTSSSCKVNMCFNMTTLSHREPVSCRAEGSSSSQSASLLSKGQLKLTCEALRILSYLLSFCVFLMIFFLSLLLLFGGASFCTL